MRMRPSVIGSSPTSAGDVPLRGSLLGALVALELALVVRTALPRWACSNRASTRGVASSEQVVAAMEPVIVAYRSGDKAAAMDRFLRVVGGDGYRAVLEDALPGAFEEAVAEDDLFFQSEQAAVTTSASARMRPLGSPSLCSTFSVPRACAASSRRVLSSSPGSRGGALHRARYGAPPHGTAPGSGGGGLRAFFARHQTGEVFGPGEFRS